MQVAGICLLIGGIMSIVMAMSMFLASMCLWLPWIFGLVAGILAIIKSTKLLGEHSFGAGPPVAQAVLLIVNMINFDMISVVMGVIVLVMVQDHDTRTYLEGIEVLD